MLQTITSPSPGAAIAAGTVFPVVCTILVGARFSTKRYLRSGLLIDDWLTLPALLCTVGMGVGLVLGVINKGLAYPTPKSIDPSTTMPFVSSQTAMTRKIEFSMEIFQFPALTCTKLSLLFFYHRVFCSPWRTLLKVLFIAMIALCIIWGLGFLFSMMFICGLHLSAYWTSVQELQTHCPHLHTQQMWLAISDCIIDGIIFLIPIPLVLRLKMTVRRKLAILAVFLFGVVTLAASITRMAIWLQAISRLRKSYARGEYNNEIVTAGLYWTMFETGLGLIVVCLPSLYILVRATFKSRVSNDTSYLPPPHITLRSDTFLSGPMSSFTHGGLRNESQDHSASANSLERASKISSRV